MDTTPQTTSPSEGYWRTLLEEGEAASQARTPPVEPTRGPVPWSLEGAVGPRSQTRPARESTWERLHEAFAEAETFVAPVIGCNKGGLLVRIWDSIGFVPASQLVDLPDSLGTATLRDDLAGYVGRNLNLRLIELDPGRCRVICSERAVAWEGMDIEARLDDLESRLGSVIEGVVRSVCDFGVFIDLGGLDGLIHISELSWQRVQHPTDIVAVNDCVKVAVLSVDRETRRVALSLKRLQGDPWTIVGSKYAVGDVTEVVITNVVDFGAFARVAEGVDGLIHISELADGAFYHPRQVVSEGDTVRVRVLHIDAAGRRLGLSLRQGANQEESASGV